MITKEQVVEGLTVRDIVTFMEEHNCYDNCCKGWKRLDLLIAISESMQSKCFAWYSENGAIKGVCIGEQKSPNLVRVKAIVCISKEALAHLLIYFRMNYPLAILEGLRDGELVTYDEDNIERMYKYFRRQALLIHTI